nr:RecName: Full=Uncharacterized protein SMPP6 [Nautilus macromphalus]
ADLFLR